MKKFLINSACFAAILWVFAIIADIYVSDNLRQSKERKYAAWNGIYNDTTCYDLVINGSSRAWVHYDPNILDSILHLNTYNLGIDGSGINRQITKYRKYCALHGQPKYLLQNIDIFTMGCTFGYEREQFFPYFFYDRDLMRQADEYEHFTLAEKYIPYYRYIGIDIHEWDDGLYKGYRGQDKAWDGTMFGQMDTIHVAADMAMLRLFDDFLTEQARLGTQVILVYSPIYHGVIDKCPDINKMYEMYGTLAKKYHLPILNYIEMPLCTDTTYFYNATHLNRQGAIIFTTCLAQDIDSMGVANHFTQQRQYK